MAENDWKLDLRILTSITFYSTHKYVLWANEGYSTILWYHPRCLVHSRPHKVTLWATIATNLWLKMAKIRWKQVFDDTYHRNLLFYAKICSMGKQMVFNYLMLSPKVPTTLMTPYSYPMSHLSQSFVRKNGLKRLKTGFWWNFLP